MCNNCYKIKNNGGRNNNKMIHLEKETTKEILFWYKDIIKGIKKEINSKSIGSLERNIQKIVDDSTKKTNIKNKIIKNFVRAAALGNGYLESTMKIGIGFDAIEETMQRYFQGVIDEFTYTETGDNIVSNMIRTIKVLSAQGAQEGFSPSQIGRAISESTALSTSRAEMIAVREMGIGYEKGKEETINGYLAENPGKKILKKWITVGDNRVTPSHKTNERDGRIPKNQTFSGTGDQIAPASDNPRCRCSVVYKIENI